MSPRWPKRVTQLVVAQSSVAWLVCRPNDCRPSYHCGGSTARNILRITSPEILLAFSELRHLTDLTQPWLFYVPIVLFVVNLVKSTVHCLCCFVFSTAFSQWLADDSVIIIIIIIMFMVLSSYSHYKSYISSFSECRAMPSSRWTLDQANWAVSLPVSCYLLHPSLLLWSHA